MRQKRISGTIQTGSNLVSTVSGAVSILPTKRPDNPIVQMAVIHG